MRERDEQAFQRKKAEIMEACFNCYAENGLTGTGIQALADACGLSKASLLASASVIAVALSPDWMRARTAWPNGALSDAGWSRTSTTSR